MRRGYYGGLTRGGAAMERWILIGGVIVIFLGLAAMGWHYEQPDNNARICASAEAKCGEQRL